MFFHSKSPQINYSHFRLEESEEPETELTAWFLLWLIDELLGIPDDLSGISFAYLCTFWNTINLTHKTHPITVQIVKSEAVG